MLCSVLVFRVRCYYAGTQQISDPCSNKALRCVKLSKLLSQQTYILLDTSRVALPFSVLGSVRQEASVIRSDTSPQKRHSRSARQDAGGLGTVGALGVSGLRRPARPCRTCSARACTRARRSMEQGRDPVASGEGFLSRAPGVPSLLQAAARL